MCERMHVLAYVCVPICVHVRVYSRVCVCTSVRICVRARTCVLVQVFAGVSSGRPPHAWVPRPGAVGVTGGRKPVCRSLLFAPARVWAMGCALLGLIKANTSHCLGPSRRCQVIVFPFL